MAWDLACPDWERRLREGKPPIPELPLDRELADQAVAIFNKLRIPDVPGTPPMGDAVGDWFKAIIAALFGSLDRETMVRNVRGAFVLVPKKNGKTTCSAGLMLTALLMNRRPRAEFVLTAPSQEITDKAYAQAKGMIELDDEGFLQRRFWVRDHIKTIVDRKTKAQLRVKTFDETIVTGAIPAGVLIDEIHLLGRSHRAAAIIGQLRGGMVSVPESFFVMITTQSFDPPAGVFRSELQVARSIRDGRASIDTLPVLYEFTEQQQKDQAFWRDTNNWRLVTPSLDRPIRLERLIADLEEATIKGEDEVRRWTSQHLNIEIGLGLHSNRWAGADYWERGEDAGLTLEQILDRCEVVVVGIDGGGLDDLFGLEVLGRDRETKAWLGWSHAWCHEGVLERRKSIATVLLDAQRAGELTIVTDELDDITAIVEIIETIKRRGLLAAVAVDPAGIGEMVEALAGIGVTQDEKGLLKGAPQGYAMMNAIKTAERKLASGTLRHARSALMSWCVGNLKIEPTATAIRATKQNAGDAKIDPVMAMFNAVEAMSRNPAAPRQKDFRMIVLG
jgi:phage terminase large subunit-like protein